MDGKCHAAFCLRDTREDNGIFFIDFGAFVECFPIATIVGPVSSKAVGATPDCVHRMKREHLPHLCQIFASVEDKNYHG